MLLGLVRMVCKPAWKEAITCFWVAAADPETSTYVYLIERECALSYEGLSFG